MNEKLNNVAFLLGDREQAAQLPHVRAKTPFHEEVVDYLNEVSRHIRNSAAARAFSDVVTFGFWVRRGSVLRLKERFEGRDNSFRLGRGLVFHVAPSNVPTNFAYSLAAGLLTGNANVVRLPSRSFPQTECLIEAFRAALERHEALRPYVILVRYPRDRAVNDYFSAMADLRIVWGGDATIAELRRSPLPPRAGEITFADRYSLAVIDAQAYLSLPDRQAVARDFYNDTYFSDQNACTSPRAVIWLGERTEEAKKAFWEELYALVERQYPFQAIQGVNKLVSANLLAADLSGCVVEPHRDNRIVRVRVPALTRELMDYRDNSGFFLEYHCRDIMELLPLCDDTRCQTIALIGEPEMLRPLLEHGVRGIDRIVPMGRTMDFDLIWDGYQLPALLTRSVFCAWKWSE